MLPLFLPTLSSQAPASVLLPVSLEPTEWAWVWFTSKGEFSSLLKEWRDASSFSRGHAVLTGCGRGCFIGSPGGRGEEAGGRSSPRAGAAVPLRLQSAAPEQRLCPRPAAILNWGGVCSGASARAQSWGVWHGLFTRGGALVWSAKYQSEASARGSRWASETRLITKEKEKRFDCILLPRFYFSMNC